MKEIKELNVVGARSNFVTIVPLTEEMHKLSGISG